MEERRRTKRTELQSTLILKRLDKQEEGEAVSIEITDVSKSGVGFNCNEALNIGAVYEGFLTIWTKEVLHAFMEIVRIEKVGDTYSYGASFVGMPEMDSARIAVYQTIEEQN
ncbi:MAG: PilZ domain-containing protein [Lachnospiraceae bacterium]|nr:PilZ domain-containing protein [Lachnospiraceae bacterium]